MGRQQTDAFQPFDLSTVAISVNNTSTNVALPPGIDKTGNNQGAYQFTIYNKGSADAYIEWGSDNTVTAVVPVAGGIAGSYCCPARSMQVITPKGNPSYLAAITDPGTPTGGAYLLITPGAGV